MQLEQNRLLVRRAPSAAEVMPPKSGNALLRQDASVEAERLLAGHGDLEVAQRYVHAMAADLAAAIAKLVGNEGETASGGAL